MAFEEGIDTLVCQNCGAHHKARWYRLPVREQQLIRCKACRNIVREGKANRDYYDVKLTEP